jgi:hypothetical protein
VQKLEALTTFSRQFQQLSTCLFIKGLTSASDGYSNPASGGQGTAFAPKNSFNVSDNNVTLFSAFVSIFRNSIGYNILIYCISGL